MQFLCNVHYFLLVTVTCSATIQRARIVAFRLQQLLRELAPVLPSTHILFFVALLFNSTLFHRRISKFYKLPDDSGYQYDEHPVFRDTLNGHNLLSLALYSQTSSIRISPRGGEVKFHSHIKGSPYPFVLHIKQMGR